MSYDPKRMPMRELERLSGFPRATILFYIKEGLLPEPEKTAPNMAYYDLSYVARLELINRLKERHNLPLKQIKKLLLAPRHGLGFGLMLEVRDRIFHRLATSSTQPPVTWSQLLNQTGLDEEMLQQLADMNLVFPQAQPEGGVGEKLYHSDNVVICRLLKKVIELGIPMNVIGGMARLLVQMADGEVNAFIQYVSHPMIERGECAEEIGNTILESLELSYSLAALLHLHSLYRAIDAVQGRDRIDKRLRTTNVQKSVNEEGAALA